ncbi:hypothetical protein GJ496_008474 [Pomphorhynchus laevis]|nr:hypothetical protein GJ496_008474 [Pomphorhynchus laevis]
MWLPLTNEHGIVHRQEDNINLEKPLRLSTHFEMANMMVVSSLQYSNLCLLKYSCSQSLCGTNDSGLTGDALNQHQTATLRSVSSRLEQEFNDKLQLALTRMNTDESSDYVEFANNLLQTNTFRKPIKVITREIKYAANTMSNTLVDNVVALLSSLQSSNDDVRTSAEDQYNKLDFQQKCTALATILSDKSKSVETRCFVAVLLRRNLIQYATKYTKEEFGSMERNSVLQLLFENISNNTLRKGICDVVAEFSRMNSGSQFPWPEILPALKQLSEMNNKCQILNVFDIIENYPDIFGNELDKYLAIVMRLFNEHLQSNTVVVRNSAAVTYSSFVKQHGDNADIMDFVSQSMQAYLFVVIRSIYDNDDNTEVLQSLVNLIEDNPKILRPHFDEFTCKMLEALGTDSVGSDSKHVIIELFITISENASKMFVKRFCPKYLSQFVEYLLKMMCIVDEDDDDIVQWVTDDEPISDDDDMSDNIVGETSLDRLSTALTSTEAAINFLKLSLDIINRLLASDHWKQKSAGLLAISAIGEGMHSQMQSMLTQLIDGIIIFLKDPHPKVRYAACNAIGQMSQDFQPQLQKLRHSVAFSAIIEVMNDNSMPRVQAHATAAMVNLLSGCPMTIFKKYLDGVTKALDKLLAEHIQKFMSLAKHAVLEQIITTISAIADMSEADFLPYYERFITKLLHLLALVSSSDYQNLRGKVIECITLVGYSVGKDRFLNDCQPMIDDLVSIKLDFDSQSDDIELTFILAAWSRLCMILGKDFASYLPLIMDPIIKAASFKPQITLVPDEDTKHFEEEMDDWEFLSLGDKQSFGIRTSGLEYKVNACLLLSCCARELREAFDPYIDQVVDLMIPLLRFYFFDSVRSAAAESLPNLLSCVAHNPDKLHSLWQTVKTSLLQAICVEPDIEVCSQLMASLTKILEVVYPNTLTPADLQEINKSLLSIVDKYLQPKESNANDDSSEDEDDNDVKSIVINKLSDIIHVSFRIMKNHYLPFFDEFLPCLQKLISQERSAFERQWVLCCFDDLIEYAGVDSIKYSDIFLNPMYNMINDPEPEVRQAVSYGIGLLAQVGGDKYITFVQKCINPLLQLISDPNSRSEDNEIATENAISAITKAMASSAFSEEDRFKMIPIWLTWLPTYADYDESEYIYGYMCMLMESGSKIVLGENNSNMPFLMSIFANCFIQDGIDFKRDTVKRMSSLIKQVEINPEMSQLCNRELSEASKLALHNAVQEIDRQSDSSN